MHKVTLLQEQKLRLRNELRAKRRAHADVNGVLSEKLSAHFLRHISLQENSIIGGYQAFRDEADPALLIEALRRRGYKIAFPIIIGKHIPLDFRLHQESDRLATNSMGILEPLSDASTVIVQPDVLLVPLLAFDKHRNRLGYGGGYYDRTIVDIRSRSPIVTLGIGYAYQEIPSVPVGPNDVKLDKIVTDINIF